MAPNGMQNKLTGNMGEALVALDLERRGYTILERNFHSAYGEIDIIAQKGDSIAFVEVKTRRSGSMVSGQSAVTATKQKRVIATALCYLQETQGHLQPRFDVAVVERESQAIAYYPAAFDGSAYYDSAN